MGIVTGYLSQLVTNGIKLLVGGSAVSSIFTTGDAVVGLAQSMKVKNYPFVYPRSFVGTWIIKYQ